MIIEVWHIEVRPDNIGWLKSRSQLHGVFDPDSEEELLRLDLAIAEARYGHDRKRIAEYLLAGREHWGLANVEGG